MLDPNRRNLYTDALTPPPGMVFVEGIATTYTLDLTTLLTMPLQLILRRVENSDDLLRDPVALLQALQQTASSLSVFCDAAEIKLPRARHELFALLEAVVHEVRAPQNGAFHPKLWVLKYAADDDPNDYRLRLLVLTRNLTADNSWDLSLMLEGKAAPEPVAANAPIAELMQRLPSWSVRDTPENTVARIDRLAETVMRTTWTLPEGFDEVRFHVSGMATGQASWIPDKYRQLVVISPFLKAEALKLVRRSATSGIALISRPDQLIKLPPKLRARFQTCYTLHEAAETEDGEDAEAEDITAAGLHAKAFIYKYGWDTYVFIGSANATDAALIHCANIEVMAELKGRSSQVGEPGDLISPENRHGLFQYLVPFADDDLTSEDTTDRDDVQGRLRAMKRQIVAAEPSLRCVRADSAWTLIMRAGTAFDPPEGIELAVWPITLPEERAQAVERLSPNTPLNLQTVDVRSITGFTAFRLRCADSGEDTQFVMNLHVADLPSERSGALIRSVLQNQSGFLRYLLMLLGELDSSLDGSAGDAGTDDALWQDLAVDPQGILESLVRAFARSPDRLQQISNLVAKIRESDEAEAILPPGFIDMWQIFETGLQK